MSLASGLGSGLAAALDGLTGGGVRPFDPGQLPGLYVTLLPALSRSQGKLWQDAGKTTPATANGDPVYVATCPFSGKDFVAASNARRPTLTSEGGGKWSLVHDGANSQLSLAFANTAATAGYRFVRASTPSVASGTGSYFGEVRNSGDGGTAIFGELFMSPPSPTARHRNDANTITSTAGGTVVANTPTTLGWHWDGSQLMVWQDGASKNTAAASGTTTVNVVTSDGSGNPLAVALSPVRLSGLVLGFSALSAGQRASLDAYLSALL